MAVEDVDLGIFLAQQHLHDLVQQQGVEQRELLAPTGALCIRVPLLQHLAYVGDNVDGALALVGHGLARGYLLQISAAHLEEGVTNNLEGLFSSGAEAVG